MIIVFCLFIFGNSFCLIVFVNCFLLIAFWCLLFVNWFLLFAHFIFYVLSAAFSMIWLVCFNGHLNFAMRNYISIDSNVNFHIMENRMAMLIVNCFCLLLIVYWLMIFAYCKLLFYNCLLSNANCYLLIAFCFFAFCNLPIVFCLLLIENCFFTWYNLSFASMSVEDQYRELLRTWHCYLWKNSYEFQRFDAQMKWARNKMQLTKSN